MGKGILAEVRLKRQVKIYTLTQYRTVSSLRTLGNRDPAIQFSLLWEKKIGKSEEEEKVTQGNNRREASWHAKLTFSIK